MCDIKPDTRRTDPFLEILRPRESNLGRMTVTPSDEVNDFLANATPSTHRDIEECFKYFGDVLYTMLRDGDKGAAKIAALKSELDERSAVESIAYTHGL